MALNKAQTSLGIKIVLIILIVAFVASFVPFVGGLFSGQPGTTGPGTDPAASVNAQYQPTVTALTNQLQSDPESYTALVSLGNTYFDWAFKLQQLSQTTPAVAGADQPLWVAAKDAYRRATEVRDDESAVQVDYAITQFYTGETNAAIERAEAVAERDPEFAQAWFNLGIFYSAINRNDDAEAALERAIELDPEGQQIPLQTAQDRLNQLRSGAATPSP